MTHTHIQTKINKLERFILPTETKHNFPINNSVRKPKTVTFILSLYDFENLLCVYMHVCLCDTDRIISLPTHKLNCILMINFR